jgi:hypothetical protein
LSQPSFWGYLMSPVFDLPSTSDVAVGDVIYSANSQFFSLPSPADGEFDLLEASSLTVSFALTLCHLLLLLSLSILPPDPRWGPPPGAGGGGVLP